MKQFEYIAVGGETIYWVLRKHFMFSHKQITKLKKGPFILVNEERQSVRYILKNREKLILILPEEQYQLFSKSAIMPDIIYEDEDICLVNKPPFMPIHPSKIHQEDTLANSIANCFGEIFVFRAVTRLDKDTSGIVVLAKNAYAHNEISKQLKEKSVKKTYYAIVEGIPNEVEIDAPIMRAEDSKMKRIVSPDGKSAKTLFKVIRTIDNLSLCEVTPITGRTHQIRVHFAHIGHPILGDSLYGNKSNLINRQALHAGSICFSHPTKREPVSFSTDLPDDFLSILKLEEN